MPEIWERESSLHHRQLLARTFRQWTGRELLPGVSEPSALARALFHSPSVVVSHGTQADPILNYGNRAALDLWEMNWEELIATPSRLTAEPVAREERARLLARVTRDGFIADYSGIRISRTGKRFRITDATVWNLSDTTGASVGQACRFDDWGQV